MMLALKIIHLGALMLGSVASLGNLYVIFAKGPHDLPAPGFVNQLRYMFRLSALAAILLLWASGMLMLLIGYGGWVPGFAFSAKIVFASVLLIIIAFLNLMAWRTTAPHKSPPSYVPMLHFIGAPCLVFSMLFAVLAFG